MKTIALTREVKARWLRALRSGKYAQGRGKLYDGHGYCCLGVLQKSCRIDSVDSSYLRTYTLGGKTLVRGLTMATQIKLAAMNDGGFASDPDRRSFKQIAHWIQHHVKAVKA